MTQTTVPASTTKLYGLDHLRTFAISFVLLYHYRGFFSHPEWTVAWGKFGWTGVDLFFVLSGYLIAAQLFREISRYGGISLSTFFTKRFFRILPAYLFTVALYFLIPAVRELSQPARLWKFFTFTQNIGLDLRTQGAFSHAWSLCIEEQFYLLLPFILAGLISRRVLQHGIWLLVSLFAAGLLVRYLSYEYLVQPHIEDGSRGMMWYRWIYYPTWCRLDGLLTGIGIAAMAQYRPGWMQGVARYGNGVLLAGLVVLTGAYFVCYDQTSLPATLWGFPLVSLGYGLLVLGAISPGSILYRTPSKLTTALATYSYGLYLIHKIVIHLVQPVLEHAGIPPKSNRMMLLCMLACLLAAWLLRILVEKPFLRLRDTVLLRRAAPAF